MQIFTQDQQHYINKGIIHQTTLKNHIQEALFNNPFKANYILSSLPGLGKTHETIEALKKVSNQPLLIEGSESAFAFALDIATAVYLSNNSPINVILDDCDVIFEPKNTNMAKKMFDQTRALKYGKNYQGLRHLCTDLQFEAIESFASPDKAGFSVPTNNITFLILTNRHLPTINEISNINPNKKSSSAMVDLHSIRRRCETKEIEMSDLELWGYVAHVTLNSMICEKYKPNISVVEKQQLLTWCYNNWDKLTERNLSIIEKLTKEMVRYPNNYLDIWTSNYIQIKS